MTHGVVRHDMPPNAEVAGEGRWPRSSPRRDEGLPTPREQEHREVDT